MAHALQFDGFNDYVSIPSGISLLTTGDYIEIKAAGSAVSTDGIYYLSGSLNSFGNIFQYQGSPNNRYRLRVASSGSVYVINAARPVGVVTIRIEKVSSGYDLLVDNVNLGNFPDIAGFNPINIGAWDNGASVGELELHYIEVKNSGSITRYYDPSASNGTGATLIDTVGGNNGTLFNFPTDDSQWIDLGGAVNYDLILDPGSYSYTGNTLNLSVGRKLDLNSGSYSYTGNPITLVYSPASINYDLVLESGVYNVTGQSIQLSRGYNLTLNTGDYSYTGEQINLSYGRSLILDTGSYSIVGYPISLNYSAFVDVRISGYTVKYSQTYYAATYKDNDVIANYKSNDMAMTYGSL